MPIYYEDNRVPPGAGSPQEAFRESTHEAILDEMDSGEGDVSADETQMSFLNNEGGRPQSFEASMLPLSPIARRASYDGEDDSSTHREANQLVGAASGQFKPTSQLGDDSMDYTLTTDSFRTATIRRQIHKIIKTPYYAIMDEGTDACHIHSGCYVATRAEHHIVSMGTFNPAHPPAYANICTVDIKTYDYMDKPIILRLHQTASLCEEKPMINSVASRDKLENLICGDQIRHAGHYVDSVPHCYGGNQCIIFRGKELYSAPTIIPLVYANGHTILQMDVPLVEDYDSLDLIVLTLDENWLDRPKPTIRFDIAKFTKAQPCEDLLRTIILYDSYSRTLPLTTVASEKSVVPNRSRPGEVIPAHNRISGDPETDTPCNITDLEKDQKESKRKSRYSDEKWQKWKTHLYISDLATLDHTLLSTTQLAVLETNPELTILKQHGKRRLHKLSQKRLKETFYTDTIVASPECTSVRGYNYTQLFIGKESHYIRVYNMKKKSQYYPDALCDFITYVGIPPKLISV
jgi:hypothetical protein